MQCYVKFHHAVLTQFFKLIPICMKSLYTNLRCIFVQVNEHTNVLYVPLTRHHRFQRPLGYRTYMTKYLCPRSPCPSLRDTILACYAAQIVVA